MLPMKIALPKQKRREEEEKRTERRTTRYKALWCRSATCVCVIAVAQPQTHQR